MGRLARMLMRGGSISVTASNVTGSDSGAAPAGSVSSTTNPNPVVVGGSGTITYSWSHVSTSSGNTPNINSATAENPVWDATVADGTDSVSTWELEVTRGGRTATCQITVTLTWIQV